MNGEEYNNGIPMGRDNKVEVQQLFQLLGVGYVLTIKAARIVKDNQIILVKKQSLRRLDALEIQPVTEGAFNIGSLPIQFGLELPFPISSIDFGLSASPKFPFTTQAGIYDGFGGFSIVTEKKVSKEDQEE